MAFENEMMLQTKGQDDYANNEGSYEADNMTI